MKLSHLSLAVLCLVFFSTTLFAQQNVAKTAESSQSTRTAKESFRPSKTQIKSAQEKLSSTGDFRGEATGKYSPEFRAALRNFQKNGNLQPSGKLDKATLAKLGIPLTDRQKGIAPTKKSTRVVFRASKDQISEAQQLLKTASLYTGEITGKYSKDFRLAIREYQSANGLRRKGSLNRATLEKLGIKLTPAQMKIPVNPNDLASAKSGSKRGPVFRATKTQITAVQSMLVEKKLYSGELTGKLSPETRVAIRTWQKSNGIKVTGTLNKATLVAMGIELTERQKKF